MSHGNPCLVEIFRIFVVRCSLLNCCRYRLFQLPSTIGNLKNLEYLTLTSSKIRKLPPSIDRVKSLKDGTPHAQKHPSHHLQQLQHEEDQFETAEIIQENYEPTKVKGLFKCRDSEAHTMKIVSPDNDYKKLGNSDVLKGQGILSYLPGNTKIRDKLLPNFENYKAKETKKEKTDNLNKLTKAVIKKGWKFWELEAEKEYWTRLDDQKENDLKTIRSIIRQKFTSKDTKRKRNSSQISS